MTRAAKVWTVVGALVLTTVVGWFLLVAAVYAIGGVMTVRVVDHYEGIDLSVPVPMAAIDAAIAAAAVPTAYAAGLGPIEVDGVELELGELGPALAALLDELDEIPDATLVEVIDGHDRVRISKSGGKLRLEIEEPGTSIDVAIPTRAIGRLAGHIAG